jgi:hypothetical protein
MTRRSMYGTERYIQLEQETGLATGWKGGPVTVIRTAALVPSRSAVLRDPDGHTYYKEETG